MITHTKTPKVNQVNEFKEIANNFANPLEIVREAISNSIDARANEIHLLFDVVDYYGEDLFRVIIKDNGKGMNEAELESFFDLGNSTKIDDNDAIGEKGHGTKVYFHSRQVKLTTYKEGRCIKATMNDIYKNLNQNIIPTYEYIITSDDSSSRGTEIEIIGYNLNKFSVFKHAIVKDYILWKTKFGGIDKVFDITTFNDYKVTLKGLDADMPEVISFGHIFPQESESSSKLFDAHNTEAPDYFCKKWINTGTLPNFPHIKYQAIFYVEGKYIKYSYNKMLRRQGYKAPDGSYTIQERYGLWLTKDYIPIQRKNEWIISKGNEYTRFHAFFNCQNFKLTANRGSVEATSPEILQDINKVKEIYESIINSEEYAILDWLEGVAKGYDTLEKEKREYERRWKYAVKQKFAEHKGVKLYEPQLESGVHALLMQLSIIEPNLFPFEMIDYNTNTGIDILVKEKNNLTIDQSRIYYVELKNFLDKTFNHSFEYLHSIVCWDIKILDGDEITDIQNKKRTLKIVNPDSPTDHTRYFLDDPRSDRKILVYVLKYFLKEKLNIEFRARQTK